jgi:hypothetical protein
MLHLTAEVIENYEGVRVSCTRKYGNGESRRGKLYKKADLEELVDEEAQRDEINQCVVDMFNRLREED